MKNLLFAATILALLSSCSSNHGTAVVDGKPSIQADSTSHSAVVRSPSDPSAPIQVSVTFNKSAILGRQFLYNADLQHSGQYDQHEDLYSQSEVAGSIPANFRIAGDYLELVTDNTINFPSDENHPELLVSRFKILSQTETQLTVSGADSAAYLAQQYGTTDPKSPNFVYLDHWIRSFEFDPNGNYILQQSSIEMGDGTVAEFMESVFPRENTKPGADFQTIKMDPENPAGGDGELFDHFRFLHGQTVFTGEDKHTWATHFDLSPKADGTPGTIDWYVTPNIPDDLIEPVKEAVEGWNRYFLKMKGINRNVMRFMGRLPEGIHLGDPRYNVINWDSRLVAGAAYESQAQDPETGKQSHSLIYMPAAWVSIGTSYWKTGIISDTLDSSAPRSRLFAAQPKCARDMGFAAAAAFSGRIPADEIKAFGIETLKDTLFHELGHALGLAHNFEGSLAFDRSKPGSLFSSSIMDYNDYEVERAAFNGLTSSDGPLLEYDRQILSAIYNKGADIAADAPTPAVCSDEEADNEAGGVNPLCIRYDIERDPTHSIVTALDRINQSKLDQDVTLQEALGRVPAIFFTADRLKDVKTADDLATLVQDFATMLNGSLRFYYTTGTSGLRTSVKLNIKSLLMYGDDLPEGYDAKAMRERVFSGIQAVMAMNDVPAPVRAALNGVQTAGLAILSQTPAMQALSASDQAALQKKFAEALTKSVDRFVHDPATGLPFLHASILAGLARHPDVPFYIGMDATAVTDYEKAIIGVLTDAVLDKTRSSLERKVAAKSLASYAGRINGDAAIAAAKPKLVDERATAASNEARETIESIYTALYAPQTTNIASP